MQHRFCSKFVLTFNFIWLFTIPVQAQIIPDSSLQINPSVVVPNQLDEGIPSDFITGGVTKGSTLFHSFQEFNVNVGRGAYFSNPGGIANILSRVTGTNPSLILGKLGVLGNANLFILNPNGIIFGPNASLDLNGSFLATTASTIKLSDGSEFSAINPRPEPLLTVSVPVGLSFTGNSEPIQVQGVGHTLSTLEGNPSITVGAGASPTGLRVQPENTIALVGGNVKFEGGVVSAPSGRIEVGSVEVGQVRIEHNVQGFNLDYSAVQKLQNIHLTRLSLLDVSGTGGGDISLLGRQVRLSDGSFALSENQGVQPAGRITVNATELVEMIGTTPNPVFKSPPSITHTRAGLLTQTLYGLGADIFVSTKDLNLISGGGITTASLLSGDGGNILINTLGKIHVEGFSPLDPINSFSIIASASFGSGKAGDVDISPRSLSIKDGGSVSSGTFGRGASGKVTVNATESINLDGVNPFSLFRSQLSSATYGSGSAEDLIVHTRRMTIKNGARVDSSTFASGVAGGVKIDALEQVEVKGSAPVAVVSPSLSSSITSSANVVEPSVQELLRLPSKPSGDAGNVAITTQKLLVDNGAEVAVRNDGTGNAGNLQINANYIKLDNEGVLTAATTIGNGGNIVVQTDDLQLRRGSKIAATAGASNGGNIRIDTNTLVALEDSDISANSLDFRGGTVTINAQGIFGTEFRDELTSESDITATGRSSELNGVVLINSPDIDFARATAQPVTEPESPEVASVCPGRSGTATSELINAGTGGIPASPTDSLNSSAGWYDNSFTTQFVDSKEAAQSTDTETNKSEQLIEAQGWKWNADGTLSTTLEPEEVVPYSSLTTPFCRQVNRPSSVAERK